MTTDVKVVLLDTNKIKPYNRNARKNDETVRKLCEIIPKAGFNQPIVVDKNLVIVKGHARWKAAVRLGMEKIPVIISTNDDETNKLDRIADNKISEFSKWDDELLRTELASINLDDFDFSDLGFDLDYPTQNSFTPETAPTATNQQNDTTYEYQHYQEPTQARYTPPEPDANYITERDVQRTLPKMATEYGAVTCPHCGTVVRYKKD